MKRILLLLPIAVAGGLSQPPPAQLTIQPPQIADPLDSARKLQEIRRLRLENEAIQRGLQPQQSAPTGRTETGGFTNGRWWKAVPPERRIGYLIGYMERYATDEASLAPEMRHWFKGTPTPGEIAAAIDAFYTEPANVEIPVTLVWPIMILKFNGSSAADVEFATERMRQKAIELMTAR